jgi:uncharacterized membrane protein YeaQ/YmgE (transglycosylase-associated protein family)
MLKISTLEKEKPWVGSESVVSLSGLKRRRRYGSCLVYLGSGFGIVGDIIVGVIGALLGGFVYRTLGLSTGGKLFGSLIVATIGAVALLSLLRLTKKA